MDMKSGPDDLSTGRVENLRTFQRDPGFRFLEGNVMDAALVHGLVAQCDRVFHLAAAVGVKYVLEPAALAPDQHPRHRSRARSLLRPPPQR